MADIQQLTFVVMSGAAVGSIYGLFAISYHLMFSVRGAVSFAQGDVTMLAGFLLISLAAWLSSPLLGFLVVLVLISLGSGLIERLCIRPAIREGSHNLGWILATVGLATFMSNTSTIIWGNLPLRPPSLFTLHSVKVGFATIDGNELLAILAGFAIVVLLRLLLNHTIMGRSIRVTAADPMAAQLCGINSDKVSLFVFMLSGLIGSISILLIAPLTPIRPALGFIFGLKGFAAATFGGLDRSETAYLGGIILGIAESMAAFFLWSGLKDAVAFLAMAVIILVSPAGLFALMRRR